MLCRNFFNRQSPKIFLMIIIKKLRLPAFVSYLCLSSFISGCSSYNVVSDWGNISLAEDGDIWTGRAYTITAENAVNIHASMGKIVEGSGKSEYRYIFNRELLDQRSAEFPVVDEFTYETPQGKKFSRRIRLYEQDPLLRYQWHIYNNGKNYFDVSRAPLKGIDLNLLPAWAETDSDGRALSGEGVTVAVLDLPVDLKHEDLADRVDESKKAVDPGSVNTGVVINNLNRTRGAELHGTSVAGIISASGFNGRGIRGIAYKSRFYSVNAISSPQELVRQEGAAKLVSAFEKVLKTADTDVVNASIGSDLYAENDESSGQIDVLYSRNIPVVHASGNEFRLNTWNGTVINKRCAELRADCRSSVTGHLSRSPHVINVAAVNAEGRKSSYSSSSSNMWISGLGGEDGYSLVKNDDAPGVVSTLSSYDCSHNNYDSDGDRSRWRTFGDQSCHYTAKMKGTSAAAPEITGIIALLKQINKGFTVPQIKYILASAARNDLKIPGLKYEPLKDSSGMTIDPGWTENSSGYRFSNWYGFGLIDSAAAVTLAKKCHEDPACSRRTSLPEKMIFSVSSCSKADGGYVCEIRGDGVHNGDPVEIESVEVTFGRIRPLCIDDSGFRNFRELAFAVLPFYTDLQLVLSSSGGTSSALKTAYSSWLPLSFLGNYDGSRQISMSASVFYREKTDLSEKWFLRIQNAGCSLDPSELAEGLKVTVEGYRTD